MWPHPICTPRRTEHNYIEARTSVIRLVALLPCWKRSGRTTSR